MPTVTDLDRAVVSSDEIVDALGIARRTIYAWRASGRIPEPDATKGTTLLWWSETIEKWAAGIAEMGAARKG